MHFRSFRQSSLFYHFSRLHPIWFCCYAFLIDPSPSILGNSLLLVKQSSIFKGEIRNRFDLISEERVKMSKQSSENLMKISWKIRKLWHFEVSQIFKKHFLTSRYGYANDWVDDVIASQFSIHFVHRNDQIFHIQLWEC